MNKKTLITVLLIGIVAAVYISQDLIFPISNSSMEKSLNKDSVLVADNYINFEEGTIREEFLSVEDFKDAQSVSISISSGDSLIQSAIGGSMEKDCVIGFILRRQDHSIYTVFLHLPGDKSAVWDEQTMNYKYRGKNLAVKLINN